MLSISNCLASHGFTATSAPHTRIPGIWKKLSSLYDLGALDEREYADAGYAESDIVPDIDASSPGSEVSETPEFKLPLEDYGDMMWQRRFAPSPSTSEPEMPHIAMGKEDHRPARLSPSVVINIEESQAAKRGTKASRPAKGRSVSGRGRTVSGGRGGRGSKRETPQEEAEEERAADEEDEEAEEERESAPPPTKRGRGAVKLEKPATKATARRSARKR